MENVGGSLIQWNFLHLFWQSSQQHDDTFEKDQDHDQATTSLIFDVEEALSDSRSLSLIGIKLLEEPCLFSSTATANTDVFLVVLWQNADFGFILGDWDDVNGSLKAD